MSLTPAALLVPVLIYLGGPLSLLTPPALIIFCNPPTLSGRGARDIGTGVSASDIALLSVVGAEEGSEDTPPLAISASSSALVISSIVLELKSPMIRTLTF